MNMLKKAFTRPMIIIVILTFTIGSFTYIFPPNRILQEQYWRAQSDEAEHQMALWKGQNITKYRLGLKLRWGDSEECESEVSFEKDFSTKRLRGDCRTSDLITIDHLFLWIKKMLDERRCGGDGCVCTGPYHLDVVYDEKYHFPRSAKPAFHDSYIYKNTNIFGIPGRHLTSLDMTGSFCLMYSGSKDFAWTWDVYIFAPLE